MNTLVYTPQIEMNKKFLADCYKLEMASRVFHWQLMQVADVMPQKIASSYNQQIQVLKSQKVQDLREYQEGNRAKRRKLESSFATERNARVKALEKQRDTMVVKWFESANKRKEMAKELSVFIEDFIDTPRKGEADNEKIVETREEVLSIIDNFMDEILKQVYKM